MEMKSWEDDYKATSNHRVMRETDPDTGEVAYRFVEVFYYDDGTPITYGWPYAWTKDVQGLQELANCLLVATQQPVLDQKDFDF